jgi:hypothetical protein
MNLREIRCEDMDWIHLAQDRDFCKYGNQPSGSIKFWEIVE